MTLQKFFDTTTTFVVGTGAGVLAKIEVLGTSLTEILNPVFMTSITTVWYAFLGVVAAFLTKVLLYRFVKKYFPKAAKFLE
jgi:hypothetical protein